MNIKKLKIIITVILMGVAFGYVNVTAVDWELGIKIPSLSTSYSWDSTISWNISMKNAWNSARDAWGSSNGVTYYYMSNSGYKQGCMKEASSSLYGEITYAPNIWGDMMGYSAKINISNPNITKTNVAKSTAVHEIGHSLGLDDLTSGTSIMNGNRNRQTIHIPQSIDKSRVNSLYS